jgi:crotonobetainyl-CoA:carnitine CoA-transferase CaiB-like acyl-CoA transferase
MQALEGIRVIDFTHHLAGPYATMMLADFGADVIKVEPLPHGDAMRVTGTKNVGNENASFLVENRGKRSIAMDLRNPESIALIHKLVADADVVIENYRPGVADKIGIGYEALSAINDQIVYCSVNAFGSTGPYSSRPGTDPVVQAMSGVMHLTGDRGGDPVLVGLPIADTTAAMAAFQAVLLGLMARRNIGRGQKIEVPMLASLMFNLTTRLAAYWADGVDPERNGSAHSITAPYQMYRSADGSFVAGAWAPTAWPRFCKAIGKPELAEDPRFDDVRKRQANLDELNGILYPLFAEHPTAEWERRFGDAEALFGPVNSISEALNHPQVQALGSVQTVDHPTLGTIPQLDPPIKMADTPGRITTAPPLLGEHTIEVLRELGLDGPEIDRLLEGGVVKTNG